MPLRKGDHVKKVVLAVACVCALVLPAIGVAGEGHAYGEQPGFAVANGNTLCAGHGAFGYFGKDNNLAGGANGYLTGLNNSALCGSRQGNLP